MFLFGDEDGEAVQALRASGRLRSVRDQAMMEELTLLNGRYVPQPARKRLGMQIEPTPKMDRPKCGAKCRDGHPCRATVVDGTLRCRNHGGLSTGPRTAEGKAKIAESNRRRAADRREDAVLSKGEVIPPCPECGSRQWWCYKGAAAWRCGTCVAPVDLSAVEYRGQA